MMPTEQHTPLIPFAPRQLGTDDLIARELNAISCLGYQSIEEARVRFAKIDVPERLLYLKDAVFTHLAWLRQCQHHKSESMLHDKFRENIATLVPGAIILKNAIEGEHRPDFLIKLHSEIMPVEIKLHKFDKKSLQQLSRYLSAYRCKRGIAVAKECTCLLPQNILFIALSC